MNLKCVFIGLLISFSSVHGEEDNRPLYNFSLDNDLPYIWFHVPKACYSTISNVLYTLSPSFHNAFGVPYSPEKYDHLYKFAFVRNPWDRIVSCYFNKVVFEESPAFECCKGKDFEYFVDYIAMQDLTQADPHIRPQSCLIPIDKLDYLGRFENFAEDFSNILAILGFKWKQFAVINKSEHMHYSHYFNERTREIIAEKYKEDIELFHYTFEEQLDEPI